MIKAGKGRNAGLGGVVRGFIYPRQCKALLGRFGAAAADWDVSILSISQYREAQCAEEGNHDEQEHHQKSKVTLHAPAGTCPGATLAWHLARPLAAEGN